MNNFWNLFFLPAFFYILLLIPSQLTGQDFNNYQNIESSGNIPKDFLTLSSAKYEADKSQISKKENSFNKQTKKQFYLESNFMINELLLNGKVLYNDALGSYVNKVLDELLKNKPELRKKIKVYIVLSPIINAYATDNGTIFVNTGLLAKLQTEAQLAFVLGHEITHYEKKHVLNRYVHNEQVVRGKITFAGSGAESRLFLKSSYAKEQEMEADLDGVELLLDTKYNLQAGIQVMELFETDLPFEETNRFNPNFFSIQNTITSSLEQVNFDSIEVYKISEDENQTHPDLDERITKINNKISKADSSKLNFVLPETEFKLMRKQAQFELAKLFLHKGKDIFALYSIYQLLQNNPESKYLNELLCKALYQTAKFTMDENVERESDYVNNFYEPKEIQHIYKYLIQFSPADLNALAIMAYLKLYPNKEKINQEIRLKDLLYDYKTAYASDTSAYALQVQKYITSQPVVQSMLSLISVDKDETAGGSKNKTKQPAINKIIVLDPAYKKFDLRKKKQDRYIASEKSLIEYHDQIETTAKKVDVTTTIISPLKLSESNLQKFREHSLLTTYLEEVFRNGNNVIATDYEKVNKICSAYGSKHIGLTGTYSFHLQKPLAMKIGVLLWTGLVLPTLPFGIYYTTVPTFRTYTYFIAINTENQSIDFKDVHMMKFRDSKGAVNSTMHYQFLKMKKRK